MQKKHEKNYEINYFEKNINDKIKNVEINKDDTKIIFKINYNLPENILLGQLKKFIEEGNKILREEYSKIYNKYWSQHLDENTIEKLRPQIQTLFFSFYYNGDNNSNVLDVILPLNQEFLSMSNKEDRDVYKKLIEIIESITDKGTNYKKLYDQIIEFTDNSNKRINATYEKIVNEKSKSKIPPRGYL